MCTCVHTCKGYAHWRRERWVGGSAEGRVRWGGKLVSETTEEAIRESRKQLGSPGESLWLAEIISDLSPWCSATLMEPSGRYTFHRYTLGHWTNEWMNKQKRENESTVAGEEGMDLRKISEWEFARTTERCYGDNISTLSSRRLILFLSVVENVRKKMKEGRSKRWWRGWPWICWLWG